MKCECGKEIKNDGLRSYRNDQRVCYKCAFPEVKCNRPLIPGIVHKCGIDLSNIDTNIDVKNDINIRAAFEKEFHDLELLFDWETKIYVYKKTRDIFSGYKSALNKSQAEIQELTNSLGIYYDLNMKQEEHIKELKQQIEKLSRAPDKSKTKFWEGFGKC